MDKFWEWMEQKEYGQFLSTGEGRTMGGYLLSKQMLIGYMIEYLTENKQKISHIQSYCMLKDGTMSMSRFIKHLEDNIKRFGKYGY